MVEMFQIKHEEAWITNSRGGGNVRDSELTCLGWTCSATMSARYIAS